MPVSISVSPPQARAPPLAAAADEDEAEEEIDILISSLAVTLPCPTQQGFLLMGANASSTTFSADSNTATTIVP